MGKLKIITVSLVFLMMISFAPHNEALFYTLLPLLMDIKAVILKISFLVDLAVAATTFSKHSLSYFVRNTTEEKYKFFIRQKIIHFF